MRKTRRQGTLRPWGNPYGIALNRAWTEWATECALAPGEMLPQTAPTARNETAEAGVPKAQ
jgi:hypothetical protein